MKWEHMSSLAWMQNRQRYLTASDIRKLVPYTKTGKKRTVSIDTKYEIAASKIVHLRLEDCMSYGAAARGHLLEPYAIKAFNESAISYGLGYKFFHIDDQIVMKSDNNWLPLAFSPDAVSLEDFPTDLVIDENKFTSDFHIAEVKCYSPGKHLATAVTDLESIEERWQIATAMAVCDNIASGSLLLYCPDLESKTAKLFRIVYYREDLENEISIVRETADEFNKWYGVNWSSFRCRDIMCHDKIDDIIDELEEKSRLNP